MAALRRDFVVKDLVNAMRSTGVETAVAVQARQTLEETCWLLECADATDVICGVVGWAPLTDERLAGHLDQFSGRRKLVALREVVQAEPDGYLDRPEFNGGLRS